MINKKIGIISGYFNPLHYGHIEYINAAKLDCDFLIAIVNNDEQVQIKKSKKFMTESHRVKIMNSIKNIDKAIISIDKDSSVSKTLKYIVENHGLDNRYIFYNSGDRNENNCNLKEKNICQQMDIEIKYLPMNKIYSSRELLNI